MSRPTITIELLTNTIVPLVRLTITTAKGDRISFEMAPDAALEFGRRVQRCAEDAHEHLAALSRKVSS